MTTPTHDLAIARAERDAWQSTCEELHAEIARRTVEIEAHLGRCEAADQRARSFEAALTAEREASKGLVAQVEALRAESKHYTAIANHNAAIEAELRAIRDLVAPGNPQGTVVDAVRARIQRCDDEQRAADRCAAAADKERDAAITERDNARETMAGLMAKREADAELAKLRAELAELRARPVLTAESLAVEIYQAREVRRYGKRADDAEAKKLAGDEWFVADVRAALAKLSPAPAREVAPTLVAVSDETLARTFADAHDGSGDLIGSADIAGIRAVRAKLGAAEVTEERLAAALVDAGVRCVDFDGRVTRIDLMRNDFRRDLLAEIMADLRAFAAKEHDRG